MALPKLKLQATAVVGGNRGYDSGQIVEISNAAYLRQGKFNNYVVFPTVDGGEIWLSMFTKRRYNSNGEEVAPVGDFASAAYKECNQRTAEAQIEGFRRALKIAKVVTDAQLTKFFTNLCEDNRQDATIKVKWMRIESDGVTFITFEKA